MPAAGTAPVAAAPPAPRPVADPPPAAPPRPNAPNRGPLVATAALVVGEISLAPQTARLDKVERLSMKGQVRLIEQPLPAAGRPADDDGFRIEGDELEVLRPQAFDTHAIVWGKPARVMGRGSELQGQLIEVDRGLNRLKVDGAGRLTGPMPAGGAGLNGFAVGGPPAAGGDRLQVTWRGRLDFDGRTAQFFEAAVAETGGARVSADVLEAVLDRPFSFEGDADGRQPPQLARFAGNGAGP